VLALSRFCSRPVLVRALLGFSAGLPLLLTSHTLGAWLVSEGISVKTIAALSAVGLPYAFKWAWAPLLDRYRLPFLGPRRGWLLVIQLALLVAIAVLGSIDPRQAPGTLAIAAVVVAFLSASQDVVIDALNAEVLAPEERAGASANYVLGYRSAMLVAGTLSLLLAEHLAWRAIYGILAAFMLVGVVGTWLADEPARSSRPVLSLPEAIRLPLSALLKGRAAVVVVAFVALYDFGEKFASAMVIPYLRGAVGFDFTEIATLNKLLGFAGTVVGVYAGSVLLPRLGVRRALLAFGAARALTNLLYIAVGSSDRSLAMLGGAVAFDNVANAMATGAFVVYLMSRCQPGLSATQYALLTSLSSLGGRALGFLAGDVIAGLGWPMFWLGTALVAVPALLLISRLPMDEVRDLPPATPPR
jgi:PAT family beta-lactamase induction signal transducer AmpG